VSFSVNLLFCSVQKRIGDQGRLRIIERKLLDFAYKVLRELKIVSDDENGNQKNEYETTPNGGLGVNGGAHHAWRHPKNNGNGSSIFNFFSHYMIIIAVILRSSSNYTF
jgi:hypothetical protein